MADIIQRYFRYKGFDVTFAMNLTDVDDKIIKKANEEKVEASEIAERFSRSFFEDIGKLKLRKADIYPRATEHMDEIINLVKRLEENGNAYSVDGDVFYDVRKFTGYGKLSGKKLDELESGARIEVNEKKHNPLDFVLWKNAKPGEPKWDSPWGKGRPGWHVECSAMSMKHLGETFDIHAGGHDLIFPHHENEIAQSEGATGKPFVKYWMHFGFLNFQDEKMSKSLGNFFTARDILQKYSAETIRLFFSKTHYRRPLSFSDNLLLSSSKALEKISNFVDTLKDLETNPGEEKEYSRLDIRSYFARFEKAMDDDFNTPQATAVIFDFIRDVNKIIAENEKPGSKFINGARDFLFKTAEDVLGIIPSSAPAMASGSLEDELIDLLIKIRQKAKDEKNYVMADEIRDEMKELGLILQDGKDGTKVKRVK
jgi:cysteinyl-tRNA synthetase